jgi:large repetitive protein
MIWSSTFIDEKGSPTESWDGTYKQTPCQQDIYVWKISAVFRDGSVWANQDVGKHDGMPEVVYGTITLIR